jgi:hypothetical protein
MLAGSVTDRVAALLATLPGGPGLERASKLDGPRLPVPTAFERLLPDAGLRPGTSTQVTGVGATTLALSLVSEASHESWVAIVGAPSLGLRAASELGVDLDHVVAISDPGKRWVDVFAAVIDAFDVVVAQPQLSMRDAHRVAGRLRERDAVLVTLGAWTESDVRIETRAPRWEGIGGGHGHLSARAIDVSVSGRRSAARVKTATLWLPNAHGEVELVERDNVVRLAR